MAHAAGGFFFFLFEGAEKNGPRSKFNLKVDEGEGVLKFVTYFGFVLSIVMVFA